MGESLGSQQLKEAGLKVTMPRIKVLQIFEEHPNNHYSAEEVFRTLLALGEDVGLATVYRVLTQFEAAGLIKRHNFESGHSVFELSDGEHHDHLVCIKCGLVAEFYDEVIETRQKEVAEQAGFKITDHSLTLYGLCPKCD
jgi:Fur family transcriptional regulator, ferric uptake regulator